MMDTLTNFIKNLARGVRILDVTTAEKKRSKARCLRIRGRSLSTRLKRRRNARRIEDARDAMVAAAAENWAKFGPGRNIKPKAWAKMKAELGLA